jgi:hypothetical protein
MIHSEKAFLKTPAAQRDATRRGFHRSSLLAQFGDRK